MVVTLRDISPIFVSYSKEEEEEKKVAQNVVYIINSRCYPASSGELLWWKLLQPLDIPFRLSIISCLAPPLGAPSPPPGSSAPSPSPMCRLCPLAVVPVPPLHPQVVPPLLVPVGLWLFAVVAKLEVKL